MKKNKFDMNELKKKIPKDHKLVNRRDFLSQGFITGVGVAFAPSLMSMLNMKQAFGQDFTCTSTISGVERKIPVIMLDLSGGAAIAGANVIVGDQGGQHSYLSSYDTMGTPMRLHPNNGVNTEFGLKFNTESGMLAGMRNTTSTTTRAKCDGGVICAYSENDTQNNPHNPMYWLNKAGSVGMLAQTAGTSTRNSGGRSIIPSESYDPTIAPVPIRGVNDAVGLANLGRITQDFNETKAKSILRTIERMSERQLASFSQKSLPEQVHDVVKCGFMKSTVEERVFNPNIGDLNPQNDNDVRAVYTNIDNNNEQRRQASLVKLVLDGYVGTGTIEMGGYDYHNNDRANTDQRDQNAGEAIGRILELAARKQTDVLVYVFSDGSVSSRDNQIDNTAGDKFRFQSDDANRSSTFMLYYKHTGRPDMKDNGSSFDTRGRQIGWFKSNQAVERGANLISNNVTNLSKAVVLNYLALHGDQGRLAELMATDPFKSDADDYILFDKNV